MLRIATLAALAALVAIPANAETIRVSTAGKSIEQVHAEVVKAAHKLCARAVVYATFPIYERQACVKSTVQTAITRSGSAELAALPMKLTQR
jgi:hypothetical protein